MPAGKRLLVLMLLMGLIAYGCRPSHSDQQDHGDVFDQREISDIACGPSALYNWLNSGGAQLNEVALALSADRSPVETVRHLIETYGQRRSATNPSVLRYGRHNGGIGSINLMLTATEVLGDHLEKPPQLRGEYLHRFDDESTTVHFDRIRQWFSRSIENGVPVLFYVRAYQRSHRPTAPAMVFGHHVVITSLESDPTVVDGVPRVGFTFLDSSSGRVERGELRVAADEFTAPTFDYRFDGETATTRQKVRTGRPLLEVRIRSYESANPPRKTILLAHFATFAMS